LVVGLDAVTSRNALEYLAQVERDRPNLTVRVFWNETGGLFHPKMCHFRYGNGREVLILGSGNLTPGGLRENFEGYTILRSRAREPIDLRSWDRFLVNHAEDIRGIDEGALERAARNVVVGRGLRRRRPVEIEPELAGAAVEAAMEQGEAAAAAANDRVLVARVPAAGGRWHQVHFNRDVIDQFFRVQPETTQRVYLVARHVDGAVGNQEVRRCVYSHTNKNYKIELGARREAEYPDNGVPIAVFRELQARSFE
jgi:hypothetical protein